MDDDKNYVSREILPCKALSLSKQLHYFGEKAYDCYAGKALNCTSPDVEIPVGECTNAEPGFQPDMSKCGPDCPAYIPVEIAICEIHGEYIKSEGCVDCMKNALPFHLVNHSELNQDPVLVRKYILIFGTVFFITAIAIAILKSALNINISADAILLIVGTSAASYKFVQNHGRTYNFTEYKRLIIGSCIFLFIIFFVLLLPILFKDIQDGKDSAGTLLIQNLFIAVVGGTIYSLFLGIFYSNFWVNLFIKNLALSKATTSKVKDN
jgi:hypothetical protein